MERKSRHLAMESLENRSLLAGNLTVSVVDGSLFITGDYQNNYVAVGNAGPNSFRIGTREGTLINGSNDTEQTFTGVTNDINIVMKGGNDQVFIGSESSHARIPRNLNVDCADDSVYLYAFCGASGR